MTTEVSVRDTYFEARNLLMEAIAAFDFLQQETESITNGLGQRFSCPADYKTELWTALDGVYRHTVLKMNICLVRLFEGTEFTATLTEDGMEVILPNTNYFTPSCRPILSVFHLTFHGRDLEGYNTCLAYYDKITREGWPKHALDYMYHYFDTRRIRAEHSVPQSSGRHMYRHYTSNVSQ